MATPMIKLINALSARTHFGEVMTTVEKDNQRYIVSHRGKPKMVLLSVEDYMENILKKPNILAEIQRQSIAGGLNKITDKEINDEIKSYRKTKRTHKAA